MHLFFFYDPLKFMKYVYNLFAFQLGFISKYQPSSTGVIS